MRHGNPPGRVRGSAQEPAASRTGRGRGGEREGRGGEHPGPTGPSPREAPRPANPLAAALGSGDTPPLQGDVVISRESISSQASSQTSRPPAPGPSGSSHRTCLALPAALRTDAAPWL